MPRWLKAVALQTLKDMKRYGRAVHCPQAHGAVVHEPGG